MITLQPSWVFQIIYIIVGYSAIGDDNFRAVIISTASIGFVIKHEVDGFYSIRAANTGKVA